MAARVLNLHLNPLVSLSLVFLLVTTTVSCSSEEADEVQALLRIRSREEIDPKYNETYKQTQAALLTSPFVTTAALRDPALSQLKVLESVNDPVEWLKENIIVTCKEDSELMRVTCPAASDEEAKVLIDVVLQAYQQEVCATGAQRPLCEIGGA